MPDQTQPSAALVRASLPASSPRVKMTIRLSRRFTVYSLEDYARIYNWALRRRGCAGSFLVPSMLAEFSRVRSWDFRSA